MSDPFAEMRTQLLDRFIRQGVDPTRVLFDDLVEDDQGIHFDYITGTNDQWFPDASHGVERRLLPNLYSDDQEIS